MEKTIFKICLFLCFVFVQPTKAQLPVVSTQSTPIWYYIQVIGEGGNREDRVFSVNINNYLYGETLSKTSDAQLFRFEKSGDYYYIISKSANKKLDVAIYQSEGSFTLTDAGIGFTLDVLSGNYYNITASQTPIGGDVTQKYAHQASSSFKIILVNTAWNTSNNSKFSFVPYDAVNLNYSDANTETWYYVTSANTTFANKCLTDITTNGLSSNYAINTLEANNTAQQWKLVKKAGNENVDFVNRSTGKAINTSSTAGDLFNKLLFTDNTNETSGWTLKYLNASQYIISGIEEDAQTRYWRVSADNATPNSYDGANLAYSDFAWKLTKVSGTFTNSPEIQNDINLKVYSQNHKIIVEGDTNYSIYTIQGVQMKNTTVLSAGIYLVSTKNKVVKVIVN